MITVFGIVGSGEAFAVTRQQWSSVSSVMYRFSVFSSHCHSHCYSGNHSWRARARLTRSRRKRRLHSVSAATVAPQVGMVVAPVHPKPAVNDAVAPFTTESAGVRCLRCKKIYFDKSGYNRHLSTHTESIKTKRFEYVLRACVPAK